eukprot:CAMPEP_0184692502 /NCGR_PEP_ID=MMETSP0313-20130426/960_1 /TAXON_ID=2792 /ORGANISM="Porphyridium aerugineum, Strain SAG 1380-2" /LENGTH=68 /DNA_ID=CAMNT_0027150337 /DNA_START=146 /DNA_END=352 /DNA_ORIENTATION=+
MTGGPIAFFGCMAAIAGFYYFTFESNWAIQGEAKKQHEYLEYKEEQYKKLLEYRRQKAEALATQQPSE